MGKSVKHNEVRSIALGGIFGALAVAVMEFGAVLPVAMFIAPGVAGLLVMLAQEECGLRMAAVLYLAISLLSGILVSDKEVALVFILILGYWPLVKAHFDGIRPRILRITAKVAAFNAAIAVMLVILFLLFPVAWSEQEKGMELVLTAVTLGIGNVAFLLYDRALANFRRAYTLLWQPRLHKMLGIR